MLGAVCGASYMRCTRVYTRVKFRVVLAQLTTACLYFLKKDGNRMWSSSIRYRRGVPYPWSIDIHVTSLDASQVISGYAWIRTLRGATCADELSRRTPRKSSSSSKMPRPDIQAFLTKRTSVAVRRYPGCVRYARIARYLNLVCPAT
eukprot:SAG31_NODE_14609_length_796_cov_2.027260_1_plen_146_part_01